MRLTNIIIAILAMLEIAKTERPMRKLEIAKNAYLFQKSRIRFCFKNQWKLKKLAQNMYPAIRQVKFIFRSQTLLRYLLSLDFTEAGC